MIRVAAGSYEGSLFGWKITPNSIESNDTSVSSKKSGASKKIVKGAEETSVELQFGLHISFGSFKTLAVSKSGKYLAVGGMTERIFLYNMNENKEIGEIFGHTGAITSLAFFEDSFIISGSEDNTLNVWRVHDRQLLQILGGHKAPVNGFAVHPTGKLAISVSKDNTMKLWNLVQGRCSFTRRLRSVPETVLWNPRGDCYLLATQKEIQLFDINNNNSCKLEIKSTTRINHVAIISLTPDNLTDENSRIVYIGDNCTINMYDLTGKLTATICLSSIGLGRLRSMTTCPIFIQDINQENVGIVIVTSNGCMMIVNALYLEQAYLEEDSPQTESSEKKTEDTTEPLSRDESIFGKALYAFHQLKADPRLTAVTAWRVKDKKDGDDDDNVSLINTVDYADTMNDGAADLDATEEIEDEDDEKVENKKKRKKVGFQPEVKNKKKKAKK